MRSPELPLDNDLDNDLAQVVNPYAAPVPVESWGGVASRLDQQYRRKALLWWRVAAVLAFGMGLGALWWVIQSAPEQLTLGYRPAPPSLVPDQQFLTPKASEPLAMEQPNRGTGKALLPEAPTENAASEATPSAIVQRRLVQPSKASLKPVQPDVFSRQYLRYEPAFRYTPPRLQLALERGPSPAAYAASAAADVPKIAAFWAGVRDRTLARLDALTREDAPLDIRPHPDCPDTYALQIKPFGLALSANPCN